MLEDGSGSDGKFGGSHLNSLKNWNLQSALGSSKIFIIAQKEVMSIFPAWWYSRQQDIRG